VEEKRREEEMTGRNIPQFGIFLLVGPCCYSFLREKKVEEEGVRREGNVALWDSSSSSRNEEIFLWPTQRRAKLQSSSNRNRNSREINNKYRPMDHPTNQLCLVYTKQVNSRHFSLSSLARSLVDLWRSL